jgi:protein involved in polysaccharide export with SLBB domain
MKNTGLLLLLLFYSAALAQAQVPYKNPESNTQPAVVGKQKVCIVGVVRKPSELPLKKGLTVSQAIEEAGEYCQTVEASR